MRFMDEIEDNLKTVGEEVVKNLCRDAWKDILRQAIYHKSTLELEPTASLQLDEQSIYHGNRGVYKL